MFVRVWSILAICLCTSLVFGQEADPFGGNAGGNPFDGASQDPFGGNGRKETPVAKDVRRTVAKPVLVDPDKVEAKLLATLEVQTSQEFIDTPLEDALLCYAESVDLPIIINGRALEEVGLTPDVPVTLSLRNVSLRSSLNLLLEPLDLTYIVKDEVVQVTTIEDAERKLVTRAYAFPKSLVDKADKIVAAIQSSVTPEAWEPVGGPCRVSDVDHVLMIAATESTHSGVVDFMRRLEKAYEAHQAK